MSQHVTTCLWFPANGLTIQGVYSSQCKFYKVLVKCMYGSFGVYFFNPRNWVRRDYWHLWVFSSFFLAFRNSAKIAWPNGIPSLVIIKVEYKCIKHHCVQSLLPEILNPSEARNWWDICPQTYREFLTGTTQTQEFIGFLIPGVSWFMCMWFCVFCVQFHVAPECACTDHAQILHMQYTRILVSNQKYVTLASGGCFF